MQISDLDKFIGNNIRNARIAVGMTQASLGAAMPEPCTPQQISKYELGQDGITAIKLITMAQVMGISAVALLEGAEGFFPVLEKSIGRLEFAKEYDQLTPAVQKKLTALMQAIVKPTTNKDQINAS